MNTNIYNIPDEINMEKKLDSLFQEWIIFLTKKLNRPKKDLDQIFVRDGFYPYYTKQTVRVLFIGREALGMENNAKDGYTRTLLEGYQNGTIGDNISINKYKFHALMFYITYLLNNPDKEYSEIEYASEMSTNFGKDDGISFAFMNLSKFSNENEKDWKLDKPLFDSFVDNSIDDNGRSFIADEIEILNPDLIITMNFSDKFDKVGYLECIESKNPDVYLYNWKKNKDDKKKILLADMWHFSAPGKGYESKYINPLLKELKRIGSLK